MSLTNILTPPIDPNVEFENVAFDYGKILAPGVTLTGTPVVTCIAVKGPDVGGPSRLVGSPMIAPSPSSGAPGGAVIQLVGGMIAGTTYQLQCVAPTTDAQILSLYTYLTCQALQ